MPQKGSRESVITLGLDNATLGLRLYVEEIDSIRAAMIEGPLTVLARRRPHRVGRARRFGCPRAVGALLNPERER